MLSKMSDPYCCKITISRLDRIGPVTVGHIPREISRYVYYFLAMDGVVSGTVINTQYSHSPIPAGGLEVPLWLTFAHRKKWIIDRLRDFISYQTGRMQQMLSLEDEEGTVMAGADSEEANEVDGEEEVES